MAVIQPQTQQKQQVNPGKIKGDSIDSLVYGFIKKDTIDVIALAVSLIFLSYLFVRSTLVFLVVAAVLGTVAVIHHSHHDIVRTLWAYAIGFCMSSLALYIIVWIVANLIPVGTHITSLMFFAGLPIIFLYALSSSLIVIYFHERLLPDINYKGVFTFIFIINAIAVIFAITV